MSNSSKDSAKTDSNNRCSLPTATLVVLHRHSPKVNVLSPPKDSQPLVEDLLRPYGAWLDVPAEQNDLLPLEYVQTT